MSSKRPLKIAIAFFIALVITWLLSSFYETNDSYSENPVNLQPPLQYISREYLTPTLQTQKLQSNEDILEHVSTIFSEVKLINTLQSLFLSGLYELEQESNNQHRDIVSVFADNPSALINPKIVHQDFVIPVLVIACNRISVRRNLDQLIKYRSSSNKNPIIVSQDCNHSATRIVLQSYSDRIKLYQHPNTSDIKLPAKLQNLQGYYKISRHYKWALDKIFNRLGYQTVIIVEDDLDISPDFFEYFEALHSLLLNDSSLYCISAWNDNGMEKLINLNESQTLYRTDFFPGLGWMMTNVTYQQLAPSWPDAFWDDWMRQPGQRRGRACIRPEVSRTRTFGKVGVSNGQYYEDHLKYIALNKQFVNFTKLDLSYLRKENYDRWYLNKVYRESCETTFILNSSISSVTSKPNNSSVDMTQQSQINLNQTQTANNSVELVQFLSNLNLTIQNDSEKITDYKDCSSLLVKYFTYAQLKDYSKRLNLMTDLKSGVPRTAYRGIVPTFIENKRIYLAPNITWTEYNINAELL